MWKRWNWNRVSVSGAVLLLALTTNAAWAVPSFARQTGQDCVACHVGGFGPQLTPFGVKFKIGGYTDSNGKADAIPLSAMVLASNNRSAKAQGEAPAAGYKTNNNTTLDEASLFIAGRLGEQLGAFVQITYDGVGKSTSIDHMDLRFANSSRWLGKDLVLGVSVNNNPSVQDPFNTLPVWSFPYVSSALAFSGAPTSSLINGGLEHRVLGASAYAFFDNAWYGELGSYRSLSPSMQGKLGLGRDEDPGRLTGSAYWRMGWFQDRKSHNWSLGAFGFRGNLQPGRESGTPTNSYRDVGLDGQFQWLGTREHIVTVQGSVVRELQGRDAWVAGGEASKSSGRLNELKLNASYHYRNTWGLTLGRFRTTGSNDALLYAGNAGNVPNTSGYITQVDWTPWGKEDSWLAPWANVRLGAQYTAYSRYNGARLNYDGNGRNASDNNTLFLFAWTSF